MTHSYFMITAVDLRFPILLAFNGFITSDDVRKSEALWDVVRHITFLDSSDFSIFRCSCADFNKGLLKIDFRS